MNCMNVCSARSGLEGGSFIDLSCHTPAKFRLDTDETLWEAADKLARLAEAPHTKKALENLEKALGLVYDTDGILWDDGLREAARPISISMYDWCHVLVVGGVAISASWLFLKHIRQS